MRQIVHQQEGPKYTHDLLPLDILLLRVRTQTFRQPNERNEETHLRVRKKSKTEHLVSILFILGTK